MLRELENPRQNEHDHFRRIFSDEYFDLYVWLDGERIVGFQLCYDKEFGERALTWREDRGYAHEKVDDGETRSVPYKMKPVLVADGEFDADRVAARFKKESAEIDPRIAAFVCDMLANY